MDDTKTEENKQAPKTRHRKYRRPSRQQRRPQRKAAESAEMTPSPSGQTEEKDTARQPEQSAVPQESPAPQIAAQEKPKGIKSAFSRLFQTFGQKEEPATEEIQPSAAEPQTPVAAAEPPAAEPAATPPPGENERKPAPRQRKTHGRASGNGGKDRRKKGPAPRQQQAAAETKEPDAVFKLLINTEEPEECRIALVENGKVEAFHIETITREKTKGNIYKGKIVAIEPSLHAVFVDIGLEKNAFLPFGEIHPEYYSKEVAPDTHWKDLNIREMVNKGQEVLVEIVKEAAGTKGANVTTYLSLPGRYLVLMPGSDSQGISRKLADEDRNALKEMIKSFKLPDGIGYIIRTASKDVTKTALSKDVRYLLNLWKTIKGRGQKQPSPSLVYREQNIIARYLRDHFSPDIQEIIVDSQEAYEQVQNFLSLTPAASQKKTSVRLHKGLRPLFSHFNVEEQIEQIYQPKVKLPSGGSIVINPTEALVAIDVNSGRTSKDKNFEESIFLANMEAAEELARQLRLRDLGGLIVVDFIDMRMTKHVRELEKQVKASMKRDKAKFDLSRISKFGLMQISRQRLGPPVQSESYRICERCQGRGMVRSVETQVLAFLRKIQIGVGGRKVKTVQCIFPIDIASYLLNKKRTDLVELEQKYNVTITVTAVPGLNPSEAQIEFQAE